MKTALLAALAVFAFGCADQPAVGVGEGQQALAVIDTANILLPDGYVITPGGAQHASCIYEVPNGSVISKTATGSVVTMNGDTLMTVPRCPYPVIGGPPGSTDGAGGVTPDITPTNTGWKAFSQQTASSGDFWSEFDSWLHVPTGADPTLGSSKVVYLFTALTASYASPEIVQPVLQYGNGGFFPNTNNWIFYYFYVDSGKNVYYSTPTGAISGGGYVETEMSASGCNSSGVCGWTLNYNVNGTGWAGWGAVADEELDTIWPGVLESYSLVSCGEYPSGSFTADHWAIDYSTTLAPNTKHGFPASSFSPTGGTYDHSPVCAAYGASYNSTLGIQTITY